MNHRVSYQKIDADTWRWRCTCGKGGSNAPTMAVARQWAIQHLSRERT